MVRRRLPLLLARQSERNWRAYRQVSENLRNGARPKGRRPLGHMDDGGNERTGSSSAGTHRISRLWPTLVTTVRLLVESRVMDDSSVERLRERQEAAGNGLRS
jgi:hypothetical protein